MIRLLWTAAWYQLVLLRRNPDRLLPLVNIPLFTAAFLTITQHAGRPDLAGYAVLGSAVIGIWTSALYVSGEIIDGDRANGVLEAAAATPAPLALIVLGRVGVVTAVSFLGVAESVLVAELLFQVPITVAHKGLFALTLVATWAAMAGTATVMSGLFVLTRSVRSFQNSLSYPFYLLSGAVVPVALLPGWLQPVSRTVFLSWASELLRDCLAPNPPAGAGLRIGIIFLLGGLAFGIGFWMINRIVHRLRTLGAIGFQ